LLRYHQFILTRRRGSRDEIAAMLGVSKNKLNDLRRLLLNFGAKINYNAKNKYYEYLNYFEFYIGPAKPTGVGW
jgi:hypothetical protein